MSKIIRQVDIPEFNDYVVLSKKRRPKYKPNGKLANPRAAGTPKLWKINGQA